MDRHSGSREELILKVLTLLIVWGESPLVFTAVETSLPQFNSTLHTQINTDKITQI